MNKDRVFKVNFAKYSSEALEQLLVLLEVAKSS